MTGNTIIDGEIGKTGVVRDFRGNPKTAVKTDGNAVYEVWEVRERKDQTKWKHRVLTHFEVATDTPIEPPPPGGKRAMALRRGDLVWWPGLNGDRLFLVKKMSADGRLHLWPARYATGKDAAPFVQAVFPEINLNGDDGYKFSSADGLRKAGVRLATISILGRVRVR
ncbi:MAG: hypothetical protein HQL40_13675 [Alphaproteobacteria bacterium]|nr:hypothetical protein [Alphaproteobacteria bacterium]